MLVIDDFAAERDTEYMNEQTQMLQNKMKGLMEELIKRLESN